MDDITYTKVGDYYLPDFALPEQPELIPGRYSRLRREYLKEHHKSIYYNYLTSCTLNEHLNDIQLRASEMEERLIKQMAASEGVTEDLKAKDMMSWVRKMNNIKNRVQEIVLTEVVYA
ncbi:MAG: TnpV protein [Clostridia bacterium]|nr:TnpV protein [Clostridia bacterium]